MVNLDNNTFLLLEQSAGALKNIADKLEKDPGFATEIANTKKPVSTSAYTITEYIFFEIISVFNLCANPVKNPEQRFALVYIGLKFYDQGFLQRPENIRALLREENKKMPDHFIGYAQKVKAYQESVSLELTSLLYPSVLKASSHTLFDAYAAALYRFASLVASLDKTTTVGENQPLKKIWELTHNPLQANKTNPTEPEDTATLEEVMQELESLIGLSNVKKEVGTLVNFIKIREERKKAGLQTSNVSYHCVFTGSPGTGKTTIARLLARIFKKMGVLKKGHLVETDRAGLVAEYAGQTAVKVDKMVQSALDGVLFIDEAYSLLGEAQDNYGQEAVAALLKRMEDYRERLVVIVAGYPQQMEEFITNNPGLKSRFNRYIEFEDYSSDELFAIFKSFCAKTDYKLAKKASGKLQKVFQEHLDNRDETFGNGRLARNIFEKAIEKQANRLAKSATPLTKELLLTLESEDIPD